MLHECKDTRQYLIEYRIFKYGFSNMDFKELGFPMPNSMAIVQGYPSHYLQRSQILIITWF